MKSNTLMKDPFFSSIILGVETIIYEHDQATGNIYNDSLIKSALKLTIMKIKGKTPKNKPSNNKDKFKHDLCQNLLHDMQSEDISRADYIKSLLAVEDSLKTRRNHHNNVRGYLDFLQEFIKGIDHQSNNNH